MKQRIAMAVLSPLLMLSLAVSGASASSVHLKNDVPLTFTDQGLHLNTSGALAGLGQQDVRVTLTATGNPTATCTNPSGKNQPPGQNPAPVTVAGSQTISQTEIKNGNTTFNVTTAQPTSPIPGAPDCPNRQWTETLTDVAFTSATITVQQPATANAAIVLTVSCRFSPPTADGPVPAGSMSCTSS